MSILTDTSSIPQHTHPTWCVDRDDAHLYTVTNDGTRELVHDRRLADVAGFRLFLMSIQQLDESGAVLTNESTIHFDGEGPLTPQQAGQLAGALLDAVRLIGGTR